MARLGSPEWQERVQVAELLGERQEPALVRHLVQQLAAPDFRVRRAAAEALGHMGAFAADELLGALTHKSDLVRQSALAGLRVAEKAAYPALFAAARGKQVTRRRAAIEALGALRVFGSVAILKECLLDPDAESRWRAAAALGELRALQAVPELLDVLLDDDDQVRWAAATALGQLGDRLAVESLLGALQDSSEGVRSAAAWALGEIGDARAIFSLTPLAQAGAPDVRRAAILALGKLNDPVGQAVVLALLHDPSTELRLVAIEALALMGGSEGLRALLNLLGESDATVRHAALEAVVGFGHTAEAPLKTYLARSTGWAATTAQEALDRLWRERRRAA